MICTHSKNKYLETILVSAKPLYLIVNPLFALTHLIYAPQFSHIPYVEVY